MTTPIGATSGIGLDATPVSAALGAAQATAPTDQLGKDTFLKLLVAQLKYQDPMSPTDGSQFLAQTAQFTQVEKLEDLSAKLGSLVSTDQLLGATALLGRTVSWNAADGTSRTGVVTGTHLGVAGAVLRVGSDDVPLAAVTSVTTASA